MTKNLTMVQKHLEKGRAQMDLYDVLDLKRAIHQLHVFHILNYYNTAEIVECKIKYAEERMVGTSQEKIWKWF